MVDHEQTVIRNRTIDAAGDWFARRQRGLTSQENAQFEAWLNASRENQLAFREVEGNWRASGYLAATTIGRDRSLPRAPFLLRRSTHAGALGLLAVAVVGTVSLGLAGRIGPFPISASAEAATYETGLGEIRTFRLSDGTKMTLDTHSAVRVDMSQGARRAVLQKGRARFDAVEDGRPFIVSVTQGSIEGRGAVFDLSLLQSSTQTTVLKGVITLRPDHAAPTKLHSGEQAAFNGPVTPASKTQEQWTNGILGFADTPLSQAIDQLNAYNSVKISLIAKDTGKLLITGGFRARDPDGFARAVSRLFGLKVTRPDRRTILLTS